MDLGVKQALKSKTATRGNNRAPKLDAPADVLAGFALLGVFSSRFPAYNGPQDFAQKFVRCSRTKFTQVTYSATSI